MANITSIHSYEEAQAVYAAAKKHPVKLGLNTYLSQHVLPGTPGNLLFAYSVKLYATDIVTYRKNGEVVLNSGGFRTSTTKDRLNQLLPRGFSIYQERSVWYLIDRTLGWEGAPIWKFADGITIKVLWSMPGTNDAAHIVQVTGADLKSARDTRADLKLINTYVNGCVAALLRGEVGKPEAGDCLYCQWSTADGRALGDASDDVSHLWSHIHEGYYMGSLIANAVLETPLSMLANDCLRELWYGQQHAAILNFERELLARQVKAALRKYLRRRLGFAS